MLLVAVQIVVLCGLALTYFGKMATSPLPPNAVNINRADATQFAQALSVSNAVGQQIVEARESHRWHQFAAVNDLHRVPALHGVVTSPIDDRFVARMPADVARGFWGGVLLFVLAFFAAHALLRKAAPEADPLLLPLTALLAGVGLMMVYTVKDPYRDTFVFTGQVWGIVIWGLIALAVPLSRPFGRLALRRYQYAYAIIAICLMLLLKVFGHGPGGIPIQVFGFEPVEFIKILLVFFAVSYLAERRGMLGDAKSALPRFRDFAPLSAIYVFTLFLFVLVRDMGPAVLLFGAFLTLLYLTTQRAAYPIVGAILLVLAGVMGYALHFGFFATRVTMWLHPWDNADPHGAQLAQGLWGMATGGLTGSGLGLGDPGLMPRSGSDLIFASLGEETGLVGSLSVLIVYCLLIARGFGIALRAVTDFDRLLAAGLTTLLALQTMIIVGGVTGLVPLTGITLPFVSFGASSLVADFFAVGVLLHLSNKTLPTAQADRATPEWTRAARIVVLGCGAYLLLGVGVFRLMDIQGVRDVFMATRPLRTPDADQVAHGHLLPGQTLRPHINPRLLAYAGAIPRGRILDRNGVVLARDAAPDEPGATGLLTSEGRRRVYPLGATGAHLLMAAEGLGSGTNPLGSDGLLRGYDTYADLLPLYRRQHLPFAAHPQGKDVALTIDSTLQQTAEDALRQEAAKVRDRRTGRPKDKGAAVLLNATTGEVLAAASLPTFNPSTLTPDQWAALKSGQDGDSTLLDRAVAGLYPPGSSFKIVTATAGLQHGWANTVVPCRHTDTNFPPWRGENGQIYARRRITDEEGFVPHGATDMAKALRVSCNVYFAHLGIKMGAKALDDTARHGFELAHLPSRAKIDEDLPDCAYGQGAITVTPLEMARVAQAVADNGQMMPLQFIKSTTTPPIAHTVMTSEQASHLQTMLAAVTEPGGTAQGVFDGLSVRVAGKTGSAQNSSGDGMTHSWFVGFAPATNPTYAFACVVENGGAGRAAAAPICRAILKKAL
jgi:cell division protein FtsW (lipid II flippase)